MAKSKEEQIFVQDGDSVSELTGTDKDNFVAYREEILLLETARLEKETARASAITKLAEIAGLTQEEIK